MVHTDYFIDWTNSSNRKDSVRRSLYFRTFSGITIIFIYLPWYCTRRTHPKCKCVGFCAFFFFCSLVLSTISESSIKDERHIGKKKRSGFYHSILIPQTIDRIELVHKAIEKPIAFYAIFRKSLLMQPF